MGGEIMPLPCCCWLPLFFFFAAFTNVPLSDCGVFAASNTFPLKSSFVPTLKPRKAKEDITESACKATSRYHEIRHSPHSSSSPRSSLCSIMMMSNDDEEDDDVAKFQKFQYSLPSELLPGGVVGFSSSETRRIDRAIVQNIFSTGYGGGKLGKKKGPLVEIQFAGLGTMPIVRTSSNTTTGKEKTRNTNANTKNDNNRKNEGTNESDYVNANKCDIPCIFLARVNDCNSIKSWKGTKGKKYDAVAIPLNQERYDQFLPLLHSAYFNVPISKTRCLSLNPRLTNRDDGLFDNLPWDTWTISNPNDDRNRDAAGNLIEKKYRFGKRDAYNRFMGKDWPGRSLSLGNLALRALYTLEGGGEGINFDRNNNDEKRNGEDERTSKTRNSSGRFDERANKDDKFDDAAATILARRVLEMELREAQSSMAGLEQERAVYVASATKQKLKREEEDDEDYEEGNVVDDMVQRIDKCRNRIYRAEKALTALSSSFSRAASDVDSIGGSLAFVDGGNSGSDANNQNVSYSREDDGNILTSVLREIVVQSQFTYGKKNNTAPYRGAYGYAPTLDKRTEMSPEQIYPYTGPFDLLRELISTQLRAHVCGVVIEDTSLFDAVTNLGGACVLRRKAPPKGGAGTTTLAGEVVDIPYTDDNDEVKKGDVRIVECDSEEALAMALTVPGMILSMDSYLWENLKVRIEADFERKKVAKVYKRTGDKEGQEEEEKCMPLVKLSGGEAIIESSTAGVIGSSSSPPASSLPVGIRKSELNRTGRGGRTKSERNDTFNDQRQRNSNTATPKTTAAFFPDPDSGSLYSSAFTPDSSSYNGRSAGTDDNVVNAIQSLDEFDSLSSQDKARILLSSRNFKGKLPRPRVLRQAAKNKLKGKNRGRSSTDNFDPLDKLLLPLMDESVRNQIYIRDAEQRGDFETANRLREKRSRRQIAREKAMDARNLAAESMKLNSIEDLSSFAAAQLEAEKWESEAELTGSIRADVTQDEGSYSRFLDKDDWYERERLARVKKLKRSSFGTLLDGIE